MSEEFRYVFGPVPSRRLGRSLGVNPIPFKTCNYSCVYCQLGRTSHLVNVRREFFPPDEIVKEIERSLALHAGKVDYVTFVGEGEPTLCQSLGRLIQNTRDLTPLPIAVITNGALLFDGDVRRELAQADVVMPSLDAADQETYQRINRPYGRLRIADVIEGMARFRHVFHGQLWIEIMLVRGVNDTEQALLEIRRAVDRVGPDRVYVNTPVRPPAERWVEPPGTEGLVRAHALLGEAVFIDKPEEGEFSTGGFDDPLAAVGMIIRRHPMRLEQILEALKGLSRNKIRLALRELETAGNVQRIVNRGIIYYASGEGRYVERTMNDKEEKDMAMSPDVMREKIQGVVIVQATPFNRDGSLDLDGLKANTQFLVERCAGKRFVFVPAGSTGEFYALAQDEQMRVIETVIETANGAVPVVAGTAAAGTERTIELSQTAEKAGADGVQIVLPFYHVPSEEGLYRHYARIADALNIGVMIYNNPAVSKLWMPPHVMARCAEHPNIVADKENTPDVTQYKAMRDAVDPTKMAVLCGLGDLQFAYEAALGCPGFVSWTANLAPELSLALLEAADACDFKRVREVVAKTGRLYEFAGVCAKHRGRDPWVLPGFASGHIYVGIMKAAMEMLGLAGGPVRGPGDDLTDAERGELRRILKGIGLM